MNNKKLNNDLITLILKFYIIKNRIFSDKNKFLINKLIKFIVIIFTFSTIYICAGTSLMFFPYLIFRFLVEIFLIIKPQDNLVNLLLNNFENIDNNFYYSLSDLEIDNFSLTTEVFLAISALILITHISIVSYSKLYLSVLTQSSTTTLTIGIVSLSIFLQWNDILLLNKFLDVGENTVTDFLSYYSKLVTLTLALISLLVIQNYLTEYLNNNGEYFVILIFSEIGVLLLISANDLLTIFLSVELQGLAFYLMAGFKKNSFYSVESGLKYFILGSLSTGLFLFGLSGLYGITGIVHLSKFNMFFFSEYSNIPVLDPMTILQNILNQIVDNVNSPEFINCSTAVDYELKILNSPDYAVVDDVNSYYHFYNRGKLDFLNGFY